MLIREVMTQKPKWVSPSTSLEECAKKMLDSDIGFLPVGENDRIVGAITDRDLATRGTAKGRDPAKTFARDVMTPKVLYCYEDDDVTSAAKSMSKQQVHRLIVLNKEKRLTGVVSLGDLATKWHQDKECGEVCHEICEDR